MTYVYDCICDMDYVSAINKSFLLILYESGYFLVKVS